MFIMDSEPQHQSQEEDRAISLSEYKITLPRVLQDLSQQPNWRLESNIDSDYYDSKQLSSEVMGRMAELGMFPAVVNLIKPAIDLMLGMEAKTRTDWTVRHDSEQFRDVAVALGAKLHEAERMTRADKACGDAYAGQIKSGLSWVEVSRNSDPFGDPYRVAHIHRNEIWWDWLSGLDMAKARYVMRRKWFDADFLCSIPAFAKHADTINRCAAGDPGDPSLLFGSKTELSSGGLNAWDAEDYEWRDSVKKRMVLYELWYRVWAPGFALKLGDGRVIPYDKCNPLHTAAVQSGAVPPIPAQIAKVRQSYWVGGTCLYDGDSPGHGNKFPYVPFIGFREDRTGVPYGMIRVMRPNQDEVNARHTKGMWLLASRRVITDDDAVLDHNRAASEAARPDMYLKLNSNRKAGSQFRIEDGADLSEYQYRAMERAADNIQRVSGLVDPLLGRNPGNISGKAANILVEQGATAMGDINDNYRESRAQVGELLLDLIVEDLSVQQGYPVEVEDRVIVLNEPAVGDDGTEYRKNDVSRSKIKVVLDSVPNTPTYRQQLTEQLMGMMQSMPPQIQALMVDYVVEGSGIPNGKEIADRIRKQTGMVKGTPGKDEEGGPPPELVQAQQELQQAQQVIQEGAARLSALEAENIAGKIELERIKNETAKVNAQVALAESQAGLEQAIALEHSANIDEAQMRDAGALDAIKKMIRGEV